MKFGVGEANLRVILETIKMPVIYRISYKHVLVWICCLILGLLTEKKASLKSTLAGLMHYAQSASSFTDGGKKNEMDGSFFLFFLKKLIVWKIVSALTSLLSILFRIRKKLITQSYMTNYSKHWYHLLASIMGCDCSKILNHGLNHELFLSLLNCFVPYNLN